MSEISVTRRLMLTLAALGTLAVVFTVSASAAPTDAEMCAVIRSDITAYRAKGHPCPCPYSINRAGLQCGDWSAWAKPGGKSPRCYFRDVTGAIPPNLHPNPVRHAWPDPPPCVPIS